MDEVPDTLGWWYRIPKLSQEWNNTQLKLIKKCGKVLPHFGSIFGISEDAMALILEAMGCLQKHGNRRCHVCEAGWEALIAEFKVKGKIEISLTRIEGASISYVRIGYPPKSLSSPSLIYKEFIKNPQLIFPPTKLSKRSTQVFVTIELVKVLRKSDMFEEFLGKYVDSALYEKIGYNQRNIRKGLEYSSSAFDSDESSSSLSEIKECDSKWSVKDGSPAPREKYPLLSAFKIPVNNKQTTKILLTELAKLQQEDTNSKVGSDSIAAMNKKYIAVPQGGSVSSCKR